MRESLGRPYEPAGSWTSKSETANLDMPANFDFASYNYISGLIEAIGHTHGVEATHQETVPIREICRGQVAWEGDVEVFAVEHPSGATRCYGWGYVSDADPSRIEFVCVLGIGPVNSPLNAIRAAICAHAGQEPASGEKKKKIRRPNRPLFLPR